MKLNVVHIFANGQTQIVSDTVNKIVKSSTLTKLQNVIDNIKSLKPSDVQAKDYHCIHIFPNKAVYLSIKQESSYTLKNSQLNLTYLNDLLTELSA